MITVTDVLEIEQVSYYDFTRRVCNFHRFPFVNHNVKRIAEIICFSSMRVIWLIGKRGCHATAVRKFRTI